MRRVCFWLLLIPNCLYYSQDISVDAISTMRVCGAKDTAQKLPCAIAPRIVEKINPSYPERARREKKEGTVTLGLTVGKDGTAGEVHVVNGVDKELDQAATEAVRRWKFEPATYEGNAVAVELTVSVNFKLRNSLQDPPASDNLQTQKERDDELENYYSNGLAAYNRGDFATAANLMRKITSISPEKAHAWNELGRALLEMNQLQAAKEAFESSIKDDPSTRYAYNSLGLVYWRQRKYEEAAAEFRKQIIVNPDDTYAHRNLGTMLRDQHRCSEAIPELQKALSLTPNHAETLLAEGACDLDLGNHAKGVSELEQATSVSSTANIFNSAAYALAKRNVEIGTAEKWSNTCLNIEKARPQNVQLNHLTPEHLGHVGLIAAYWDTRGWIYFLRGDTANARSYVEAAWSLRADPTVGDHLGQIYEKAGYSEKAGMTYAMAIASADLPTRTSGDQDDVADARKNLTRLAGADVDGRISHARADLSGRNVVLVANQGALSASADFAVKLSLEGKATDVFQVGGDQSLSKTGDSLRAARFPITLSESLGVELPLRGTLTCHSEEAQCRFALMSPEEAVSVMRNELAEANSPSVTTRTRDPHLYDDPALGMRISLLDDWELIKLEPGSFSSPRNAMFGKPRSLAMLMLTHERFEGSTTLYLKTLDNFFSRKTDFKRTGEETVKRDGLTGTRWIVYWSEDGVAYHCVTEIFGVGEDYYRITALAPQEIYDRNMGAFESMERSIQFPMLRTNADLEK
jgi:TonB family protein